MGVRVGSNAKTAPGLRGHITKAGASFSGARRGPYRPAWIRRQLAAGATGDAGVSVLEPQPRPAAPPDVDRDGRGTLDLPSLLLGLLFIVVLVAVSSVRV